MIHTASVERPGGDGRGRLPAFGPSTLVFRPAGIPATGAASGRAAVRLDEDASLRPGRYDFESGHRVVWFDPNLLGLDAQPLFGIRQEELIGKDAPAGVVAEDLKRYEDWRESRSQALASGSRPSAVVQTATVRAGVDAAAPADVEVVALPRAAARPGGTRFGALVHAALADIDFEAGDVDVDDVCALHARILGASSEESAAAVEAVSSALRHPLLQRARAAQSRGECRRETPIGLREADGVIVDGVVDLAFLENGAWTVVDFKTDRELSTGLDDYKRQVALYARAVEAATGQAARGVLLRV